MGPAATTGTITRRTRARGWRARTDALRKGRFVNEPKITKKDLRDYVDVFLTVQVSETRYWRFFMSMDKSNGAIWARTPRVSSGGGYWEPEPEHEIIPPEAQAAWRDARAEMCQMLELDRAKLLLGE